MKYNWDRISYTEERICQAGCNRPLSSGIAHVIVDETGQELHCGKNCAERKAGTKPQGIPNLTLANQTGGSHEEREGGTFENNESNSFENKKKVALEYLLLRSRFNHCKTISMKQIDVWNNNRNDLDDVEILRIYNLRQANLKRGKLSPLFLKKIWELQNIMFRYGRIRHQDAIFLQSLIDFVGSNLSLSAKQKKVLLSKFDNLELDFLPDYKSYTHH